MRISDLRRCRVSVWDRFHIVRGGMGDEMKGKTDAMKEEGMRKADDAMVTRRKKVRRCSPTPKVRI
ncbi:MAG: hypothetical protein NPIRA06_32720 [Nitrospirales bacterium]|nr:MAG: hypothetical protein NPIRA06_32720 [Nitrospirales bacterium]